MSLAEREVSDDDAYGSLKFHRRKRIVYQILRVPKCQNKCSAELLQVMAGKVLLGKRKRSTRLR